MREQEEDGEERLSEKMRCARIVLELVRVRTNANADDRNRVAFLREKPKKPMTMESSLVKLN